MVKNTIWAKVILFGIFIVFIYACAGNEKYKMKTVYIYEVSEKKAALTSAEKSIEKFEGIASDTIIEESPNIKGVTRITDFKTERSISYPTVSADGSFVVFSLYDPKVEGINIWKKNVMGGGLTRLTKGPYRDIYPTISNDGKHVYFSSDRAGNYNIWRINITGGGGITRITTHMNKDFAPNVSNDDTKIVFHSFSPGDIRPQIWTCRTNGTLPTQLRIGYQPKWSKDDRKILFIASHEKKDYNEIWEMNTDGTSTTQHTSGIKVINCNYAPNGQIVYSAINENIKSRTNDIWIGNTQITTNPSDDDYPSFDDQGRLFFRSNRGYSYDLWMTTIIDSN